MESRKRKEGPGDVRKGVKKSKGGSGGKWQTPHQKSKGEMRRGGGKIEPGDAGVWATCVKGKEGAATEELKAIFNEYAERLYGVVPAGEGNTDGEDEDGDIEASIRKEVASMADRKGPANTFTPVYLDLQCVLFFKTVHPIVPVDFVQRICSDARSNPSKRRTRFLNRLSPMTLMGKATERGLEEVGDKVLVEHFQLASAGNNGNQEVVEKYCSYAIRPTIRNHNTLKRDVVINLVASLVGPNHKVDLTNPDKVIVVEIYQTVCGMSVVGGDWEEMKRFNLAEIYQPTSAKPSVDPNSTAQEQGAMPKTAETGDAAAERV